MKVPLMSYADTELLFEKIGKCYSNPKSHRQLK